MKKYIPFITCLVLALIMLFIYIGAPESNHINTYPNLPAPIGNEKILITSAGQAVEGAILESIAENLNLETDFRPRALATDLYDYQSVVIVLGYSSIGLSHTLRTFQEELQRIDKLVKEAELNNLPIILVNLSGAYRDNRKTQKLFNRAVTKADYYIGLKGMRHADTLLTTLNSHQVPTTLVNQLQDIQIPFNSAFR